MAGKTTALPDDFRDLLRAFVDREVRFLIVGAYALALLGRPRATGDLDVWIDPTRANARRAYAALRSFGAPLTELAIADLHTPGTVFQIGVAPLRIDILTQISGVAFAPAFARATPARLDDVPVRVLSRQDFIDNKRASGRLKDRADIARLGVRPPRRPRR